MTDTDHITVTDARHIEWCVSGPDGMATYQFCGTESCLVWQDTDGGDRLLPQDITESLTRTWVSCVWTTGDLSDDGLIWAWLDWIYSLRGAL